MGHGQETVDQRLSQKYSMMEYKGLSTCFSTSLNAQEASEFLRDALRDLGDTELQMVRAGRVDRTARTKASFLFPTRVGAMWA